MPLADPHHTSGPLGNLDADQPGFDGVRARLGVPDDLDQLKHQVIKFE